LGAIVKPPKRIVKGFRMSRYAFDRAMSEASKALSGEGHADAKGEALRRTVLNSGATIEYLEQAAVRRTEDA
jgi:hypothetical protein